MLFSVLYKICDLTRYNFKPIEIHVGKLIARYSALQRLKHSKYVIILIIVMPKINLEDALDEGGLEEYDNKYSYCYFESFYGHAITSIIQMSIHIMIKYRLILNGRTFHMITSMIRNLMSLYDLCMFTSCHNIGSIHPL